MATIEERLVQVETKVEAFMSAVADLKGLIAGLDQRIAALDQKIDRRFEAVDRRFEAIDQRFLWMIGIQFGTLLAIVAGLFGLIPTLR